MSISEHLRLLAIDGGGTRCRVAAGRDGEAVSVETGSANVSTDFDGTVRALQEGLERLAARLGCPVDTLHALPVFMGLAGATGPQIADRLRHALPLRHLRIADDRPAALRGALGRRDGVIAHCGTGSFHGAQIGGDMRFSGGWGPVLGDEASAQWVGRAALRVTLEVVDGRRAHSALTHALLDEFGDAAGIVRFAGCARPSEFGTLAPRVTGHAANGDTNARDIMRLGADDIARALRCLCWQPGQAICLTGGIGPHFAPYLPDDMRADLTSPEGEPLAGALSLAEDFAQEIAHERS